VPNGVEMLTRARLSFIYWPRLKRKTWFTGVEKISDIETPVGVGSDLFKYIY
jgi:hypothetical protein